MSWMEFVASLTASLAWPLAALVAAWWLRGPLTQALNRATTVALSAGGVTMSFDIKQDLAEAKAIADSLPSAPGAPQLANARDLADSEPAQAVLQAWREGVVPAIQEFARRRGDDSGFLGAVSYLRRALRADYPDVGLLGELAELLFDVFKAAHNKPEQVTPAAAKQFVQLAEDLTGKIRHL